MTDFAAPRSKHADLTRPDLGDFARHELAFLGAPCGDIQRLAALGTGWATSMPTMLAAMPTRRRV
jgi:hypothetical protein